MELNNLKSTVIFPSQSLKVDGSITSAQLPASKPTVQKPTITVPPSRQVYKVKSGDTLSRIAAQHGVTVASIQKDNSIKGHLIYPGQNLSINGTVSKPAANAPAASKPSKAPNTSVRGIYTVVSGDTLSSIAYRNGLSLTQLRNWNNLTSSLIRVGQKLKIENGPVEQTSNPVSNNGSNTGNSTANSASANTILSIAKSRLNDPYVWGGSSPGGFDCSGYIYYVYSKSGINVPRTNAVGFDARSYTVRTPQVGDLVFFRDTYKSGISHVGIYLGNNSFIHAGGNKVQITSLSDSYWSKHFDSYKRLYAMD